MHVTWTVDSRPQALDGSGNRYMSEAMAGRELHLLGRFPTAKGVGVIWIWRAMYGNGRPLHFVRMGIEGTKPVRKPTWWRAGGDGPVDTQESFEEASVPNTHGSIEQPTLVFGALDRYRSG